MKKTYILKSDRAWSPATVPVSVQCNHKYRSSSPRIPIQPTEAEEAAWHLLKSFVNPIDCNQAWSYVDDDGNKVSGIRPMNLNDTLNQLFNGSPVQLNYLTKRKFIEHCRGQTKLYYRSRWNGFACSGYGGSKNAWKKLKCDARRYGLDGKKLQSKKIAVLLLGFDVDCHNGETDVQKTTDLILSYFPDAYVEPSTNGQGRHIYVKLFYPINHCSHHRATLTYIHDVCSWVAKGLDEQRQHKGYDAPLDRIRGLPTIIGFDRTEDGKVRMVSGLQKDGSKLQKPLIRVAVRTTVIKLPFYRGCSTLQVDRFFASPFYSLEHLIGVRDSLHYEGYGLIRYEYDDSFEQALDAIYTTTVEPEGPKGTSAYTNQQIHYTTSVYPAAKYHVAASNLSSIQDSHERRVEFAMLMARHLRRVPTPLELEDEYRNAGLHKPDSKSDADPVRFQQIAGWLSTVFRVEKLGFNYSSYAVEKALVEAKMVKRVQGLELAWSKWRKEKLKSISIERLSALWWLLRRSQGEQPTTHFSYSQAQAGLQKTLNVQKPHRAELGAMFRVLEQAGLIERAGGYWPGNFGRRWLVKKL